MNDCWLFVVCFFLVVAGVGGVVVVVVVIVVVVVVVIVVVVAVSVVVVVVVVVVVGVGGGGVVVVVVVVVGVGGGGVGGGVVVRCCSCCCCCCCCGCVGAADAGVGLALVPFGCWLFVVVSCRGRGWCCWCRLWKMHGISFWGQVRPFSGASCWFQESCWLLHSVGFCLFHIGDCRAGHIKQGSGIGMINIFCTRGFL